MKKDELNGKNGGGGAVFKDSLRHAPQLHKKQRNYFRGRTLLSWLLTFAMVCSVLGLSSGVASADPPGAIWGESPIAEPYPYVQDGGFTGTPQSASPDPLVN
ncbi:MAG: hypothetical protein LBL54_05835, partial [Clostridiales Family XIII bacterium]|nr:hypothetical protein [Clostridiales Family XIII bacterium]